MYDCTSSRHWNIQQSNLYSNRAIVRVRQSQESLYAENNFNCHGLTDKYPISEQDNQNQLYTQLNSETHQIGADSQSLIFQFRLYIQLVRPDFH